MKESSLAPEKIPFIRLTSLAGIKKKWIALKA